MSETLADYVASQDELVKEAGLALPHQFSQCSYALGPVRQAVYLCLTCPEARGLCSACSIACHTDHNQIELFPKRNFRCDCPTTAIAHACTLHTDPAPPNAGNQYGQNFHAKFCRCGRPYDAKTERETMIQCLSCEDWFHESCCMLRARPDPRPATPAPDERMAEAPAEAPTEAPTADAENAADADADDAASDASSSGLPPPLITSDDYDAFVCRACVQRIPALRRLAGTPGAITVIRADVAAPWTRLGDEPPKEEDAPVVVTDADTVDPESTGAKRALPPPTAADEPALKRTRTSSASSASTSAAKPCLAPPPAPLAQAAYAETSAWDADAALCTGDVFLTEDFRARWCRCDDVRLFPSPPSNDQYWYSPYLALQFLLLSLKLLIHALHPYLSTSKLSANLMQCLSSLEAHPYLLEEEETYEPPEDPDSGLSLEELGMRALARLPRDRAIDGIMAFNAMRDNLRAYLRPFAEEGKVVGEADVQSFFEELNRSKAAAA
ncbi:hypothetical protein B0H17DRAFT_973989 [Mycena rosella]|uniref:UBR-type domain-containing protein n=1 Tax=Mycena rosella TaxID=1033263 RepID=A0AAD7GUH2_MYCRO|nr:hypothetical protein B0H17DRAFT_973989 [Mycena rosella]